MREMNLDLVFERFVFWNLVELNFKHVVSQQPNTAGFSQKKLHHNLGHIERSVFKVDSVHRKPLI